VKKFITITLFCLAACNSNDTQQRVPIYDETSLKAFVLASPTTSEVDVTRQLDSILQRSSRDSAVFRQTITFLEVPFSNPNSSYRNPTLYAKILAAKTASAWYIPDEKKIAADRIHLLQQNNVGHPANDFIYTTPAGYRKKMHDIKSRYLLLYFNNPECPACKEMKTALMNSPVITQKIQSTELKLLSIYTDKDEKLWLDHLKEYPGSWIQGRDDDEYLYRNNVYDLRAIPTIYLLDESKNVLLKDCMDVAVIEATISQ
jgi:hypothetical protein